MLDFDPRAINFLAVIVAAVATFFLGAVWYTVLFGDAGGVHGYTDERMRAMQDRRPMPVFFAILLVCYFIIALVMAAIVAVFRIETPLDGVLLGFLIWVMAAAIATMRTRRPTGTSRPT